MVLAAALAAAASGCADDATPGSSFAPDPEDLPATFVVPDAPRLRGIAAVELVEASDPEGRAFAWILFAAQDPAGYVTTNQIWIPEADMVRFLVGERVVLPDEDDRQEPLGYGTRSEGANGHPIDVLRWRHVIAIRLESPRQGEVVLHLDLGEAVDEAGEVVAGATSDASISGRLNFTCVPSSRRQDPLFENDPFCIDLWERAGGLEHLSDAFSARE